MDGRLEVEQLMDSIRTIGFLSVDRMVVVSLPQENTFKVIEGNRRLGAIKSLLEMHETGEIDIEPGVLNTLSEIAVLVLEEDDPGKQEHLARVLQGVRHVSSIKPWGPYQQAQVIMMMLHEGRDIKEVREILGLSARRVNTLRRCYSALQQMKNDADYGDNARPNLFSFFEEMFKSAKLYKDWLDWDDEAGVFGNEHNRKMVYCWMVGEEVDGERQPPRISDSKEIRKLSSLIEDTVQFQRFCDITSLSIDDAVRGVVAQTQINWRPIVTENLAMLLKLPAADLQDAQESDLELLTSTRDLCNRHLEMIQAFRERRQN